MISVSVKGDLRDLSRGLDRLQRQALPAAVAESLNRSAASARMPLSRAVEARTGIKASALRKHAIRYTQRAKKSEPLYSMKAELVVTERGVPITAAARSVRQTRTGVIANLAGRRVLYKGAFTATMASGHLGVFKRLGTRRGEKRGVKIGKHVGKMYRPALKIVELKTEQPGKASRLDPRIPQAFEKHARAEFPKHFASRLPYHLSKIKR